MALKLREYWFGWLMGGLVFVVAVFMAIVTAAPHNDVKMRGFTPCTYRMAAELGDAGAAHNWPAVITGVGRGYYCYGQVMAQGVSLWLEGKQPAIWSNYLFSPEIYEASPDESEPFSADLLEANLLDEEEDSMLWQQDINKESNDEREQ